MGTGIRLYDGHDIAPACRGCRVAQAQPEVAVGIHSIFERSDRPLLVSSPDGIADDPADLIGSDLLFRSASVQGPMARHLSEHGTS